MKKSAPHHEEEFIKTGVPGFDSLFERGIPKGVNVVLTGGAGVGKTIFALQLLAHQARLGKKCYYMSFEEHPERLLRHMDDFGWNPAKLVDSGALTIKRCSPYEVTTAVEGMLEKLKGELLIDIDPVFLPKKLKPEFIVIDSLSAIASTFNTNKDSYRIYLEQLFRTFENLKTTSFLISESAQHAHHVLSSSVEDFLADGVIKFYNFRVKHYRQRALEIIKMRGSKHEERIVATKITTNGINVYPEIPLFEK